jgi:hypothetical protein
MTIGNWEFTTKKAAGDEIRRILHTTSWGIPLAGADADLIVALLMQHPRATAKIGPGIRHIEIGEGPNSSAFYIVRTDGSRVDFSYLTALNGDREHPALVRRGMRNAVDDQILEFRRAEFAKGIEVICPLTRAVLHNDPTTHVDHIVPFLNLANQFAADVGGYQNISIFHSEQMAPPGPQLTAPWRIYFAQYHRETAKLRLVLDKANLGRS